MPEHGVEVSATVESVLFEFDLAELRAATVEAALRDELDALRTELATVQLERDDLARQRPPTSYVSDQPTPVDRATELLRRGVNCFRPVLRRTCARVAAAKRRFGGAGDRGSGER